MTGAILCVVGTALSYFATSLAYIILMFGLLMGKCLHETVNLTSYLKHDCKNVIKKTHNSISNIAFLKFRYWLWIAI